MKHWQWAAVGSAGVWLVACASGPERDTLAELRDVEPDVAEVEVEDSLDRAMASYRDYLEETPESVMTPEALRRLADLQIEKQYGIIGDGEIVELAAPEPSADVDNVAAARPAAEALSLPESARSTSPIATGETAGGNVEGLADLSESDQDFETRTTGQVELTAAADTPALGIPTRTTTSRRPARWKRSRSTSASLPSIRTTSVPTRCSINSRARTTRSVNPRKR